MVSHLRSDKIGLAYTWCPATYAQNAKQEYLYIPVNLGHFLDQLESLTLWLRKDTSSSNIEATLEMILY